MTRINGHVQYTVHVRVELFDRLSTVLFFFFKIIIAPCKSLPARRQRHCRSPFQAQHVFLPAPLPPLPSPPSAVSTPLVFRTAISARFISSFLNPADRTSSQTRASFLSFVSPVFNCINTFPTPALVSRLPVSCTLTIWSVVSLTHI